MNFVFLMDPLSTVIMGKDTSFILMLEGHKRGHSIFFVTDGGMTILNGKVYFHAISVIPQKIAENPFILKKNIELSQDEVDCVFVRSDPPFDSQYLLNTWILDRLPKHIPVINSPAGLRTVNEKIWVTQFDSLIPRTFIGRNRQDMLDFIFSEKNVIAKPTDGHGGTSVFHIQPGDKNTNVILESLTKSWSQDIILQQYIPEAQKGDKRILLLNGEPLGAILRVHAPGDHRNNFFAGGKPMATELTGRDKEIIQILKPELQRLGLYFVGIDTIGNYLTEVNVTSPTCLQEMNQIYGENLEVKVIDFAEKLIQQCRN